MKIFSKECEEALDNIIEQLKPELRKQLGQLLFDNGFGFCPKCPHKINIEDTIANDNEIEMVFDEVKKEDKK
jgi:hypothetical protein